MTKLQFNVTLEPVDVRAVIDANNIKWKPTDVQCIDILEEAYKKTDEVGLSESSILQSIETAIVWAIEEQLDFDDFCKEELNEEPRLARRVDYPMLDGANIARITGRVHPCPVEVERVVTRYCKSNLHTHMV